MRSKLSPEDWARLSALFDQALDQPESARAAWLTAREPADAALADPLRALLAAHADRGAAERLDRGPLLNVPGPSHPIGAPGGLAAGQRIGPCG